MIQMNKHPMIQAVAKSASGFLPYDRMVCK